MMVLTSSTCVCCSVHAISVKKYVLFHKNIRFFNHSTLFLKLDKVQSIRYSTMKGGHTYATLFLYHISNMKYCNHMWIRATKTSPCFLLKVVLLMRPENQVTCHSKCGTIKIPLFSKAVCADQRPKFCSPFVTSL